MDLVYFKGYIIYAHDMMGINRLIMVRENVRRVPNANKAPGLSFGASAAGKVRSLNRRFTESGRGSGRDKSRRWNGRGTKEIAEMAKSRGIRIYHQGEVTRYRSKHTALGKARNVERGLIKTEQSRHPTGLSERTAYFSHSGQACQCPRCQ
jgi:hypothetical protein